MAQTVCNMASIFLYTDDKFVERLEKDSEFIEQSLGDFKPLASRVHMKFFYEDIETPNIAGHAIMARHKYSNDNALKSDSTRLFQNTPQSYRSQMLKRYPLAVITLKWSGLAHRTKESLRSYTYICNCF